MPLDDESIQRFATRLYHDHYKKTDMCTWLAKDLEFNRAVLQRYMGFFDFTGLRIDEALRLLQSHLLIGGEVQQQDRIFQVFADRFHACHPDGALSCEAIHFLTFAIQLLATDLANVNNPRKMTRPEFVANILQATETNGVITQDAEWLSEYLKTMYDALKQTPIVSPSTDGDEARERLLKVAPQSEKRHETLRPSMESLLPLLRERDGIDPVKVGHILIRRLPAQHVTGKTRFGNASWHPYFARLTSSDLELYHFTGAAETFDHQAQTPALTLSVRNALASALADGQYSAKRRFVFTLEWPGSRIELVQLPDQSMAEVKAWVGAMNFWAALQSKEPLPLGVGAMKYGFEERTLLEIFDLPASTLPQDELASLSISSPLSPSSLSRVASTLPRLTAWKEPGLPSTASQIKFDEQLRLWTERRQRLEEEIGAHSDVRPELWLKGQRGPFAGEMAEQMRTDLLSPGHRPLGSPLEMPTLPGHVDEDKPPLSAVLTESRPASAVPWTLPSPKEGLGRTSTLKRRLYKWWTTKRTTSPPEETQSAPSLPRGESARPSTSMTQRSDDSYILTDDSHLSVRSTSTMSSRRSDLTRSESIKQRYPGMRFSSTQALLQWVQKAERNWSTKMRFLNFELVKAITYIEILEKVVKAQAEQEGD